MTTSRKYISNKAAKFSNSQCILFKSGISRYDNCLFCSYYDDCSNGKFLEISTAQYIDLKPKLDLRKERENAIANYNNKLKSIKQVKKEIEQEKKANFKINYQKQKAKWKEQEKRYKAMNKVINEIKKPKRQFLKPIPNEKVKQTIMLTPIMSNIIRLLEINGKMERRYICECLLRARTTIYDNLLRLQKAQIVEKESIQNGKRGRPIVFWKLKEANK